MNSAAASPLRRSIHGTEGYDSPGRSSQVGAGEAVSHTHDIRPGSERLLGQDLEAAGENEEDSMLAMEKPATVGQAIILNQAEYRRHFFGLLIVCNVVTAWAFIFVRISAENKAIIHGAPIIFVPCIVNAGGGLLALYLHSANVNRMKVLVGRFFWLISMLMMAPIAGSLLLGGIVGFTGSD